MDKKLRIAFVSDAIYPYARGGKETRLYNITNELYLQGHEVHIFSMKWWEGASDILSDGIHLHGVCPKVNLYSNNGKRSIFEAIYFSMFSFFPLLFSKKFDIIDYDIFPYFHVLPSLLISKIRGAHLFITWHEVWGDYWYDYSGRLVGSVGKFIEYTCAKLTKNNIAVSEMTKSKLMQLGVSEKNIFLAPNGINFKEIDLVKPNSKCYDLISVGRLIEHKRIDYLIDVMKILVKSKPGLRCLIIGDGPNKSKLEQKVESFKLSKNIIFTGSLEKQNAVFSHMKSSKVFIFPSAREGFGIVVLEANACGLPVVCTDAPNNASKDLITEGVNGYVVKNGDINAMAEVIRDLLSNKEKLKRMRESSQKIAKNYSWEKIADQLIAIYTKND